MKKLKSIFITSIINNPKKTLLLGLLICLIFTTGLLKFKDNYSSRIWFDRDSKQIQKLDQFERRFGGDLNITLIIKAKNDIFDKEHIKLIEDLTEELWAVEDIVRIDSIANYSNIEAIGNDVEITPLFETYGDSPQKIKEIVSTKNELKNNLISEDFKLALIVLKMKPFFENAPNYKRPMETLEKVIKPYQVKGFEFLKMGNVSVTYAFRKIANQDNLKIIPFMFIFILVLLIIFFRNYIQVLTPLVISLITISSTLGFMCYAGIVFNSILAAIPGILLAICLADTIHIMTSFNKNIAQGLSVIDAISKSMHKNYLATILTTLTTSISFFTISFTELAPIRHLGILAGFGCILAWIFTFLTLPPLFIIFSQRVINKKLLLKNEINDSLGRKFVDILLRYKSFIIIAFFATSIFSAYLSLKNEVNSDPINYFAEGTELKNHYNTTKKHFPGSRIIDIVIDSGQAEGVKDPIFLNTVDKFINAILRDEEIVQVNSIIETLKNMNQQIMGGDQSEYKIPSSQEKVAESLFLYTLGLPQGMGIENQVTLDNRFIKLSVKWAVETTKEGISKEAWIHKQADSFKLNSYSGGSFPIYAHVNTMVVKSFFQSMAMALVFVSLIILIIFKDFKLSLISMLPNVLPLLFGSAYMAYNNIFVDVGTSIVAAICLGIAVDDTIHFVTHFSINNKEIGNPRLAMIETFKSTGQALILTTILLVVGFGSFVMSDFLPNHFFGVLCAVTLTAALITDLVLLPVLLINRD